MRQRYARRDRRLIVDQQGEIDLPGPSLEPFRTGELDEGNNPLRRFDRRCERKIDVALHAFDNIDDPGRFDFLIDVETFSFFNYQYILYGMDYGTAPAGTPMGPSDPGAIFARIRKFGDQAIRELPSHRDLIEAINIRR